MLYYRKQEKNGGVLSFSTNNAADVPLGQALLPASHGAVIGVALNDKQLQGSLEAEFNQKPHVQPPKTPVLHIKTDNTHIGHGQNIEIPNEMGPVFAGPSLGIVIGKKACRVDEVNALDYVKGYTIINEVSLEENSFYRPAVKAKCRDTFCPIGPWVIDKSKVNDVSNLNISTSINGVVTHENNTDQLVYSVEQIISYISSFITLQEGDVLIAGTPKRSDNLRINVGDRVCIEIENIGRLENTVTAE